MFISKCLKRICPNVPCMIAVWLMFNPFSWQGKHCKKKRKKKKGKRQHRAFDFAEISFDLEAHMHQKPELNIGNSRYENGFQIFGGSVFITSKIMRSICQNLELDDPIRNPTAITNIDSIATRSM